MTHERRREGRGCFIRARPVANLRRRQCLPPLPAALTVEETDACFIVGDHNGQAAELDLKEAKALLGELSS
jgi:hypothetical protein